jgi:RNA polymerase sigma factor (sigma-70 family)
VTKAKHLQVDVRTRTFNLNKLRAPNCSTAGAVRVTTKLLSQAQCYLERRKDHDLAADSLEDAWREFYELCTAKVRNFAFGCGIAASDVADCQQAVWAELIARLPAFQLDPMRGQFETWLFRIVRSKVVDLRRLRQRSLSQDSADILLTLPDHRTSPGLRSESEETAKLVWKALRIKLSPPNLEILQLRLVEHWSGAEVAQLLGLTHEQVRHRYRRGRHALDAIAGRLLGRSPAGASEGAIGKNCAKT